MAFRLAVRGAFDLAAAARFAAAFPGTRVDARADGLRLAWAVDGDWRTVVADLHATPAGIVGELEGRTDAALERAARRDVERILSIDVDGRPFDALGDPVVAGLRDRHPGLRPVLFFTPYEAAAWAIIGQRIRRTQAAVVMRRLADDLGEAGAFPAPARLAGIEGPQAGLTPRKVEQLRAVAGAAIDGRLGRDHLRGLAPEAALEELREIPGVGPFSAELILIRGAGVADAVPHHEGRFLAAARHAYGLEDDAAIEAVAEGWRPCRTWVALLLRVDAGG